MYITYKEITQISYPSDFNFYVSCLKFSVSISHGIGEGMGGRGYISSRRNFDYDIAMMEPCIYMRCTCQDTTNGEKTGKIDRKIISSLPATLELQRVPEF